MRHRDQTGAIRIHRTGGVDVLQWESIEVGPPKVDQVLIRQTAIGLNFIDTYLRSGLYPTDLPTILGFEGAGVVEAVGEGVETIAVGDRVAYATGPIGAYSQYRIFPAIHLVKIPDAISDQVAACVMLKGMTVEYLLNRTYEVQSGDIILFHAISGGVGNIACQWAKHLGAKVIGTVGSPEKAELARANGCDYVVEYRRESFLDLVMEVTNGQGVPVVYDAVGQSTFENSLNSLRIRGLFVSFGQASGSIPKVDLRCFSPRNLYFTRPSLFGYCSNPTDLANSAGQLFDLIQRGVIQGVEPKQSFALADAADAHTTLESRQTQGSTILIP